MTFEQTEQQVEVAIEMLILARDVYEEQNLNEAEHLANEALAMLLSFEKMDDLGDEKDTTSLRYKVLYHIAHAYNRLMVVVLSRADCASAFDYGTLSIAYAEKIQYYNRIAQIYCNLGAVYMTLDEDLTAIEYCRKGLAIASEYCEISYSIDALLNLGEAYRRLGNYSQSLEYSLKALAYSKEESGFQQLNLLIGNIGVLYMDIGEYSTALEYLLKALQLSMEDNDQRNEITWLGYLGQLYCKDDFEGCNASKAEEYFLQSFANIEEDKIPRYQYRENYKFIATLYQKQGLYAKAYELLETFLDLENEVKSAEAKKEATKFDYAYKIAERDKNLAVERAEADATKRLLYKTLPKSIAERVIQGEARIADHFPSASILFADVVGFTQMSANLPPAAVLGFMNFLFEHFDTIAERYGCERIKTIGDGYMAVCGAPISYDNHAERLALMALAMMEDILLPQEIREYLPTGTEFHLRIGMHCGEITAGLIGTGKLAYDIYGDTVNTASRMESHGEAGKIHVSEEFMHAFFQKAGQTGQSPTSPTSPESPKSLHFQDRGEMEIKGKGLMKTYFLEGKT